ncbi:MAG TPA: hypothetical protein VGD81_05365 [Opitutaceae bacterium]
MHRFEAILRPRVFWVAVIVPPVLFWSLVQILAYRAGEGAMSMREVFLLVGLAQVLPLAALAWMLYGVCGYTIYPGKVIVHRVVSDRVYPLARGAECVRRPDGEVEVRLPRKTLRLRVTVPEACLARLRAAVEST